MGDSKDSLQKLEEKLLKALELFRQTHEEKRLLLAEVKILREQAQERPKRVEALEHEVELLRHEREDVKQRIERLIGQIESLTKVGPES